MKNYRTMVRAALGWALLLVPEADAQDEVRVGQITIVGNETTGDNYIRLLIHLHSGGKFSGTARKETERALRESNMWKSV